MTPSLDDHTEPGTFSPQLSPAAAALRRVVTEIEVGTAKVGWDRPPALYALVPTTELLDSPEIPADVESSLRAEWDGLPTHLSAVLQDDVTEDSLEQTLPRLAWPPKVVGAALSVERIIVPPEVEDEAPEDPDEAASFVAAHPARTDIRVVVGVNRDGDSWCEVRTRTFDHRDHVGSGENLVPALVEGLRLGFIDPDEN